MALGLVKSLYGTAFINGSWVDAHDGSTFEVTNPADETVIAEVANCGEEETKQAINAAVEALPVWSALPAKQKSSILRKWFELKRAEAELEPESQRCCFLRGEPLGAESNWELSAIGSDMAWEAAKARTRTSKEGRKENAYAMAARRRHSG